MRVEAGGCIHTTSDGETMATDVPLSRTQVDLIRSVIKRHGRSIDTVSAVEVSEASTVVEYYQRNGHDLQLLRSELPNMSTR